MLLAPVVFVIGISCSALPEKISVPSNQTTPHELLKKRAMSIAAKDITSFRECYVKETISVDRVLLYFQQSIKLAELRKRLHEVYGDEGVDYFANSPGVGFNVKFGWKCADEEWWQNVDIEVDGERARVFSPHLPYEDLRFENGAWRIVPPPMESMTHFGIAHEQYMAALDYAIDHAAANYDFKTLKREATEIMTGKRKPHSYQN